MENNKKKTSSLYKYGKLDEYTGKLISGELKNTNVSLTQLQKARDCSRQDILEQEGLTQPKLKPNGIYMTVKYQEQHSVCSNWESFEGLPQMHGDFGSRRGRKARMRDAILKNHLYN